MRPFEIALSIAIFSCVLFLLSPIRNAGRWVHLLPFLALSIAVIQVLIEGHRWQMFPAYALVGALVLSECKGWAKPFQPSFIIGLAALSCLVAAVLLSTILPVFELPALTGPYKVGTETREITDWSRRDPFSPRPADPRRLMIQFWYPAEASARGRLAPYRDKGTTTLWNRRYTLAKTNSMLNVPVFPSADKYPVLVYVPSWWGLRTDNTVQVEYLASHGYVVVAIDHPYSSSIVSFPDGSVIRTRLLAHESYSSQVSFEAFLNAAQQEVRIRADDAEFVLNTLKTLNENDSRGLFTGKLDLSRVGIFGFSLGGAVAAEASWLDPRFKAGINMDGMVAGESAQKGTRAPFLLMFEDDQLLAVGDISKLDSTSRREAVFNSEQDQLMKKSLSEFGGYYMLIPRVLHNDFSDAPYYSPLARLTQTGPVNAKRVSSLIDSFSLAFFDKFLRGRSGSSFDGLLSEFPEVRLQTWKVPGRTIQPSKEQDSQH